MTVNDTQMTANDILRCQRVTKGFESPCACLMIIRVSQPVSECLRGVLRVSGHNASQIAQKRKKCSDQTAVVNNGCFG